MKTYGYALASLAVIATGWGVVAPGLISADSDFLVICGFLVALAVPAMLFGIYRTWRATPEAEIIINKIKDAANA